MDIKHERIKALDWDTIIKEFGLPCKEGGGVKAPDSIKKDRTAYRAYIEGATIDLLSPTELATAVCDSKKKTTGYSTRKRDYTTTRGLIRWLFYDNKECSAFVKETEKGYCCLGGEGCPVNETDGSTIDLDAPAPDIEEHCVECQGELNGDYCQQECKRQERNMAFVLYTAPMKWVYSTRMVLLRCSQQRVALWRESMECVVIMESTTDTLRSSTRTTIGNTLAPQRCSMCSNVGHSRTMKRLTGLQSRNY